MGHLLRKVRDTKNRGIVGVTEDGKEVLLSNISSARLFRQSYMKNDLKNNTNFNQRIKHMIENAPDNVYFLQGESSTFNEGTLFVRAYNEFTEGD